MAVVSDVLIVLCLLVCSERVKEDQPPTADAEQEWFRMERDRLLKAAMMKDRSLYGHISPRDLSRSDALGYLPAVCLIVCRAELKLSESLVLTSQHRLVSLFEVLPRLVLMHMFLMNLVSALCAI